MEDTAMNEDRKVGRVDEVKPDLKVDTHRIKNEDLEKEYAYALATKMIKGMLDGGIITQCDSEENFKKKEVVLEKQKFVHNGKSESACYTF